MKQELKQFYNDVVSKPLFWLPVLLFTFAAFGFDLVNVHLNYEDFRKEFYDFAFLKTRWGFAAWNVLTGLGEHWTPYADRFLSILFLVFSGVGLSFVFYRQTHSRSILSYVFPTSIFVTFPLFLNIYLYAGANYVSSGGLFLSIVALSVLDSGLHRMKRIVVASFLMVLPVSGYEVSVFSYLTLASIILFYQYIVKKREKPSIKRIATQCVDFLLPLVCAFIVRIVVATTFNLMYDFTDYNVADATGIKWLSGGVSEGIMEIAKNGFYYGVAGLVYLPITIFLLAFVAFFVYVMCVSIKRKTLLPVWMACMVVLCIFSLSILQGSSLAYRTAQTISVFVAFVSFLFCEIALPKFQRPTRTLSIALMFGLCWHQAQFFHRMLSLDSLRTENELAMGRMMGMKLTQYPRKPVVFTSIFSPSNWIEMQMKVDETTWNGKLYKKIATKLSPNDYEKIHSRYSRSYMNITSKYIILKQFFSYCGYDIEVLGIPDNPTEYTGVCLESYNATIKRAMEIARDKEMGAFEIYDNGDFLIVQLGGKDVFY